MSRRARPELRLLLLAPLVVLALRNAGGAGEPSPAAEPNRRVVEGFDVLRKAGTARTGRLETPLVLPAVTLSALPPAEPHPGPPGSTGQVPDARGSLLVLPPAELAVDDDPACWSSNLFLRSANWPFHLPGFQTYADAGPVHCLSPFLDGPPLEALTSRPRVGLALPWQCAAGERDGPDFNRVPHAFDKVVSCCCVTEAIHSAFGRPLCPFAAGRDMPPVCLLTGEPWVEPGQPDALTGPLGPRPVRFGAGLVEPVALAARVPVTDVVFVPGGARVADPAVFSDKATGLMLGFNWYLTSWMRTQINWAHVRFPRPVRLGPGPDGFSVNHDALGARLQIIF